VAPRPRADVLVLTRYNAVNRVLLHVLFLNLAVAGAKLILGYATGAVSVISDGFHSLSDSASNVMGFVALRASLKPPDDDHPYGHRKYETLAAAGIFIFLLLVVIEVGRAAVNRFGGGAPPQVTPLSFVVMIATVVINLIVVRYERAEGRRLSSELLQADALHTQRAHADYLHERGAGFVFTRKQNQPRLFAALDALPWAQTPIAARQVDRGHGRVTTRTIQVMPAPEDLPFPHVNQVWLIERYVTALDGTPSSAVAALGVTNLTAGTTAPQRLAALVRNHWGIESLHWLRDTVYREDNSTVRTSSGPRVMAGLRNLAVGAHHLAGRRDIAEASREASRVMHRPFKILKLT